MLSPDCRQKNPTAETALLINNCGIFFPVSGKQSENTCARGAVQLIAEVCIASQIVKERSIFSVHSEKKIIAFCKIKNINFFF